MKRVIGYYDDGLHRAGTGRYLAEVIGGLDRKLFHPVFFAPSEHPWHEDLACLGVEMIYGEKRNSPDKSTSTPNESASISSTAQKSFRPKFPSTLAWVLGMIRETLKVKRLLEKRKVDLLHSNNTGAEPAPIAARMARVPKVIGTFHVLPSYDLYGTRGGAHFRQLEKWSMNSLHHATSCCEAASNEWRSRCGFSESLVTVIHNGIDLERVSRKRMKIEARKLLGLSENSIVIGAIGNLHKYKGYEFLLRAIPSLQEGGNGIQVVIAGTGPEEEELNRLILSLGIQKCVKLLGFCDDVSLLLDSADIYVQPSLVEAFPIAILEASYSGLPVVATSVGGVPEAILNGETGLLIPPSNSYAIASALLTLSKDQFLRERLGGNGKSRVADLFTRDQMVQKTVEVYERVIG